MIKPLTSLRFLFAFCVFLSHYTIEGSPIFYEGYIGVEFFFILSGFIISYKYTQKIKDKTISIKQFLAARIARIYPLHGITCLLVVLFILLRNTFRIEAPFPWPQLLFNILLVQSFFPDEAYYFSFNSVSWSISDELFFYAMFPALIYCLKEIQRRIRILICILLLTGYFVVISIIPEDYIHAVFYINPCLRIIDFMIGVGIFYLWGKMQTNKTKHGIYAFLQKKSIATIIEITILFFLALMISMSANIPQRFRYASYYWIPIALTILYFAWTSSGEGGLITKLLSWKPLVVAGEISFGFYMLHQKAIEIGKYLLVRISEKYISINETTQFIIILTTVLVSSFISCYFFERPANKFIRKLFA
jgi:peptidoglycan/LPS O-acetylase OafA/YrhL